MNRRILLISLAGALAGGAAALALLTGSPVPLGPSGSSASTGKALIGGPFLLVDQTGRRVTEKDFAGRLMLVYFGFTACPDICPSGLQVIAAALDKLGARGEKVVPVFITLDPERDTPEVLGGYVKSFHPRLVGLSGTPEEIAAATKAYRVYAAKVPSDTAPGAYSIDHSGFMYLMDGQGQFVQHFKHTVTVEKLVDGIAKAL